MIKTLQKPVIQESFCAGLAFSAAYAMKKDVRYAAVAGIIASIAERAISFATSHFLRSQGMCWPGRKFISFGIATLACLIAIQVLIPSIQSSVPLQKNQITVTRDPSRNWIQIDIPKREVRVDLTALPGYILTILLDEPGFNPDMKTHSFLAIRKSSTTPQESLNGYPREFLNKNKGIYNIFNDCDMNRLLAKSNDEIRDAIKAKVFGVFSWRQRLFA